MNSSKLFPEWIKIGMLKEILGLSGQKATRYAILNNIRTRVVGKNLEFNYSDLVKSIESKE